MLTYFNFDEALWNLCGESAKLLLLYQLYDLFEIVGCFDRWIAELTLFFFVVVNRDIGVL